MIIEIKNKIGETIINFTNFKKESDVDPIFINTRINVKQDGFNADLVLPIELTDYQELQSNLKKLYDSLYKTFFFQDIESRIIIKFETLSTGEIKVSGILKSENFLTSMEFSFFIGQELIPELINQCEIVIKDFQNNIH